MILLHPWFPLLKIAPVLLNIDCGLLFSTADYLEQASNDLACYSRHAGRRTITVDDVKLLLHRQKGADKFQRVINSKQTFERMVNTYLPMEYTEQLLPCVLIPSRDQ